MRRRTISRCVPGGRALCGGFTLIELLVVISIVALLMAVLLPTLQRVRTQAKAVACQSNLHQWALILEAYTAANHRGLWRDGNWFGEPGVLSIWAVRMRPYVEEETDVWFCPMARKLHPSVPEPSAGVDKAVSGRTFNAWRMSLELSNPRFAHLNGVYTSSYGASGILSGVYDSYVYGPPPARADVPILMDALWEWAELLSGWGPPPYADYLGKPVMCINRHNGGINMLFADWSARKVGLKELWTLKWQKHFDTANAWTRAGGVQPEDWPEWMRRFKDYLTRRMAESRRTRMRVGWEKTMKRRTIFRCVPGGRGLRGGFTLIELLVVISIVALLTAILLPAAGRVRKQARAVACQGQLRQWGLVFSAYLTENNNDRGLVLSFVDAGKPGIAWFDPIAATATICCFVRWRRGTS